MIEKLSTALRSNSSVLFGYLFGSRARGDHRPGSDADVAVWLDVEPALVGQVALDLAGSLPLEIGVDVDVVALNRASLLLRQEVVSQGRLLVERDRAERVSFESLTILQFIDFEPIRRRCAEGLVRRIRMEALGTESSRRTSPPRCARRLV